MCYEHDGWKNMSNKCINIHTNSEKNWNARQICLAQGADLAFINSAEDFDDISMYL